MPSLLHFVRMLLLLGAKRHFSQMLVHNAQNKKEYYDYYYILHNFIK